jgi:hypothetical protein
VAPVRPDPNHIEPPRLTATERALVAWVAQAQVGEPLPEPWRWARNPMESVIRTLVEIGVMQPPAAGTQSGAVADEAAVAARRWLAEHSDDDQQSTAR